MQFGFMPGRGTTDALFVVRRMQEEYRDKKKKLYMCFVNIEKAFDGVPRKVMQWAMRKKGLPEVIVRTVMSLYYGAKTKLRVGSELSQEFLVQVVVHLGSRLSQLLFAIAVGVISENAREGLMNEILYADDLVVVSESIEDLKEAFESKGLKVTLNKTKAMVSGSKGEVLKSKVDPCSKCGKWVMANSVMCRKCGKWVQGKCAKMKRATLTLAKGLVCELCVYTREGIVEPGKELSFFDQAEFVKIFCYLGDRLNASGGSEAAVTARTRIGWTKFRECGELLYRRKFSLKMKGRIYQGCIGFAMLCGSET